MLSQVARGGRLSILAIPRWVIWVVLFVGMLPLVNQHGDTSAEADSRRAVVSSESLANWNCEIPNSATARVLEWHLFLSPDHCSGRFVGATVVTPRIGGPVGDAAAGLPRDFVQNFLSSIRLTI